MPRIVVRTQRHEIQQRRRVLAAVAGTTFILGFIIGFISGAISSGSSSKPPSVPAVSSKPGTPSVAATPTAARQPQRSQEPTVSASPTAPVIAWQPSHQEDTATPGYHEYRAMGSLAGYAAKAARSFRSVLAWDIHDGLFGKNSLPTPINRRAFDKELVISNEASATYFVGLQTEVSAEPGAIVYYQENDDVGAEFASWIANSLSKVKGFENSGRLGVRFYSLDPSRNKAPYRAIVEFRQPAALMMRMTNPTRQEALAQAIASAIKTWNDRVGTTPP